MFFFLQLMLEANVDTLQIQVTVAFTTLMMQLNACVYALQRIIDVGEPHCQNRNHGNEGLTVYRKDIYILPSDRVAGVHRMG